ncbi:MAG: quinone-dependent dihydroorotate dehydrogenase [Alphaproteobacteria bacterium]
MSATDLALRVLSMFDPERAHNLTLAALRSGFGPRPGGTDDPILATEVWGRRFANPVGLPAGFDKNAVAVRPLLRMGFGFVEIGTVTPRPQPGNPQPRLFRLPEDRAVINRLGFNSEGLDRVVRRLRRLRGGAPLPGVLGINVGMNKDAPDPAAAFAEGARRTAALADYLVVNVSSPNTPGLRALQGREALLNLLGVVQAAMREGAGDRPRPPLLIKVAPDLTDPDKKDIAEVALERGVDGLIVSNTTIARPSSLKSDWAAEAGGLSGAPLLHASTAVLADMYRLTGGTLPIIGVGGIASGADAYAKIRAGASLVQLYSALVFHGPALVQRVKAELAAKLRADKFASVAEAVGADHR